MLVWATEAANAAGWYVVCRGALSVVLKVRCQGGWDGRVLVTCRAGIVTAEGRMQRSLALSPRLASRREVFSCRSLNQSGCGPWLYWLLRQHFGACQVITAAPTIMRSMPRVEPLLARAAGMASQERATIDKITEGLWRVVVGGDSVYIQLGGRRAHAIGLNVAVELDLASAFNANKVPPWDGCIDSGALALWVFQALRVACTTRQ